MSTTHPHRHTHATPAPATPTPTGSAPPGDPLVWTENLSVRLGGRVVLSGVTMAVHPGEVVTLIGPNGAGKTTLARAVLGLIRPSDGRVQRRPGLRVGYMPQRLTVDATLPLTVRRFLALWRPVTPERITEALEEAGVTRLADAAVQTLSGGEMQRVLLARALLGDPQLLVLDEPDQAVDVHGQAELFARIEQVRRRHRCGVLLVSHDLHTVMARTDRVICLNGHVCCHGRPEDVSRHPEYHALFGRHAAELAVYLHHHDHAHDPDRGVVSGHDGDCCHG